MQVYGLVGDPVDHSLSPPMHEVAYEALGMDARYVTFAPARADFERAIDGAEALGVAGLNVTIPFKQAASELVEPDDLAARVGAVNTVDFGGDRPTGHNTDVAGVRRAFAHNGVAIDGRRAVVVGAGGAGRAATVALENAGASVAVANRTVERAASLADDVPGATAHGLDALGDLVPAADLLVNATTVGTDGDATPVDGALLHGDLAVLDAVYRPLETPLLAAAGAAGATTIDGAWMLLFQGVEAFERWTGRSAPVDAMNARLRANV